MSKKKSNDNEVMTFADVLSEHGIDTNLDVNIVEFTGKLNDISEKLLKFENLTLYYTIKKIISEILQKGSIQLLDAKYLKSFADLITTSSTILDRIQNIDVKAHSMKDIKDKDSEVVHEMTEEEIIQCNRQRQFDSVTNQLQ